VNQWHLVSWLHTAVSQNRTWHFLPRQSMNSLRLSDVLWAALCLHDNDTRNLQGIDLVRIQYRWADDGFGRRATVHRNVTQVCTQTSLTINIRTKQSIKINDNYQQTHTMKRMSFFYNINRSSAVPEMGDMGQKVGVLCCVLGETYHVLPCNTMSPGWVQGVILIVDR